MLGDQPKDEQEPGERQARALIKIQIFEIGKRLNFL